MKYVIMYEKNNDIFTDEYESKTTAIKEAETAWSRMTPHDKNHCTAFYVLESINPDVEAINHLDGEVVKAWK